MSFDHMITYGAKETRTKIAATVRIIGMWASPVGTFAFTETVDFVEAFGADIFRELEQVRLAFPGDQLLFEEQILNRTHPSNSCLQEREGEPEDFLVFDDTTERTSTLRIAKTIRLR